MHPYIAVSATSYATGLVEHLLDLLKCLCGLIKLNQIFFALEIFSKCNLSG